MSYCLTCDKYYSCEMADTINFCDECKDADYCTLRLCTTCPSGHDIECNNGFEPKDYYCSEEDDNE